MSLKRFNAEVRAARSRLRDNTAPGVTDIERGDSEGEVVVTLVNAKLSEPLPIRLLAQNIDEYPDGNNFLLFIDSHDETGSITAVLEDLQNFTFGQKILEAITTLSTGIQRALNEPDSGEDTNMGGTQGPHPSGDEDDDYDYDDEMELDDYFNDVEFGLASRRPYDSMPASGKALDILQKVRRDLRKARRAGCKVSILSGLDSSPIGHCLSLSMRASKLGLSQEALEAWDIEASDYIVLLMQIGNPYPSADKVTEQVSTSFQVQFRLGKCTRYKPSLEQALAAFATINRKTSENDNLQSTKHDDQDFQKIFISSSLEQYMNDGFIALVKLRFRHHGSWDDANEELRNLSTACWNAEASTKSDRRAMPGSASNAEDNAMGAPGHSEGEATGEHATTGCLMHQCSTGRCHAEGTVTDEHCTGEYQAGTKTLPAILLLDSFKDTEPSIPLIAMQFAIHYLVRCTQYCVRCHRKINEEFEALKPFVCSDPLCLFQYITMGLGPSIEHEIITQPYVVDLLVSLCYSSVQSPQVGWHPRPKDTQYPIRDFPSGLRLKVPNYGVQSTANESAIPVIVDLDREEAFVLTLCDLDRIPAGTWVVLRHIVQAPAGQAPAGQMVHTFYNHASIKSVDRQLRTLALEMRRKDPCSFKVVGKVGMDLLVYSTEFDDLDGAGKAKAMIAILDTLPPIAYIRECLIKKPQSTLKSYHGVSPAAATLLEWIVASNRSCIYQVSPVADQHSQDKKLLATIKTRDQEAIPSMDSCVQFRFAQGAPDKELRFHRALMEQKAHKETQFPTIFAWHGSSLPNWHSILRHGLDFKTVSNGRAFGNGVYFSQDYNTSTGYTFRGVPGGFWQQSALQTSGVISLCEIVNAPKEFVSTSPHLVVNQVDWIQCRYLFVQPSSGLSSSASPVNANTAKMISELQEIPQDPSRPVYGPDNNVLKIPLKATHHSLEQSLSRSSSKRTCEMACSSESSDDDDGDELGSSSDEEGSEPPPFKRVSSEPGRESSADTVAARHVTLRQPPTPPQSDFRPGSLDLSTLPRLPVPGWANSNSTKRLASDIKHLQKVQANTPLHELGWYVDFDKVDNMFQWIVELHSFDPTLPLSEDMKKAGITSIVLEVRFGREYPFSPPFVRVVRPRFLPFASGGGGHVTIGGAVCLELLTSTGWSPVTSMEAVFLSVRMALSEEAPAARLESTRASSRRFDYGANEALDAYVRFAQSHGWKVPDDLMETAGQLAAS